MFDAISLRLGRINSDDPFERGGDYFIGKGRIVVDVANYQVMFIIFFFGLCFVSPPLPNLEKGHMNTQTKKERSRTRRKYKGEFECDVCA